MSETNRYGIDVRFRSGYTDGESVASSALISSGWAAGQALAVASTGLIKAVAGALVSLALAGYDELRAQSPFVEGTRAESTPVVPRLLGTAEVRMEGSYVGGSLVLPFKATPTSGTWAVDDKLYIAADGTWDNTPASEGDPHYGRLKGFEGLATAATAIIAVLQEMPIYSAAGADGKTLLNGAGAPGAGVGVVGDFYINTSANTIYGPKTESGWGSPTSLVGADGADGASAYCYVAFASANDGTGFSLTPGPTLNFIAFKTSTTELTPVVGDFAGLWVKYFTV